MPLFDPRTLAIARTILILAAIGAFIYGARHTLIAFLLAIFFAYLVEPLVARVERWHTISRGSRGLAIAEVYVVLAIIFAGIVLGVGPYIVSEGRRFVSAVPTLLDKFGSGEIVHTIGSNRGWSYQTQRRVEQFMLQYRTPILMEIKRLGLQVGVLATDAFWVVLIPILAIPFLKDGGKIADFGIAVLRLRPRSRKFVESVLDDVHDMASNYIRAQLMLVGLALVVYTVVLTVSRVQYGTIIGVIAGILEFIPMVGPLAGAIIIMGIAFLTGYHHLWLLLLFLGCWRLLQDYVNSPRLMNRSLELHPFAVIFAILAGGEIAGVLGVFLSIPIAATLHIIWRQWRAFREPADEEVVNARPPKIRAA